MSTPSHKQKSKKNRFQKKIRVLQTEQDELGKKLLQYESELAEQIERFERAEQEYKRKIYSLEQKLQSKSYEKTPTLYSRLMNWMFFGVACSVFPLVTSLLYIWLLGYNITLSSIISDFLLVLFAVSINLMSILLGSVNRGFFFCVIFILLARFSVASLELSIMLSSTFTLIEMDQAKIRSIFLFAFISLIIVAILGIIVVWQAKNNYSG